MRAFSPVVRHRDPPVGGEVIIRIKFSFAELIAYAISVASSSRPESSRPESSRKLSGRELSGRELSGLLAKTIYFM